MMKRFFYILLSFYLLNISHVIGHEGNHNSASDMSAAAVTWLGSLKPDQREQASYKLSDKERENWNFLPTKNRKGLAISAMRNDQRHLAYSLLSSGLSQKGFLNANQIMALEHVLWELEHEAEYRDTLAYYITIFGDPNSKNWGWRFEGHHLSLNFTIVDGKTVSGTPNFFAANPGVILKGPQKGLQVLKAEENEARTLISSFNEAQRKLAVFSQQPPREILTRSKQNVRPLDNLGIPWKDLTVVQRKQLMSLIEVYIHRLRADVAVEKLAEIEGAGYEKIRFAWAGGLEKGQGHYYRVQGPTFLLEYANTQNDARHVHSVWRDFDGDFGRDLLKEHFDKAH